MECRDRLEQYFRDNGVPFEVQEHEVAYTAQQVAATEHVPGRMLAKVVMAHADGELVMLVVPAPYLVDLDRAGEVLGGKRVRLATEDEFAPAFPDCEPGAMPPFGNLYGLPVYADRRLAENETLVIQAGTHTVTMTVPYADFERLVQPTIAEFGILP